MTGALGSAVLCLLIGACGLSGRDEGRDDHAGDAGDDGGSLPEQFAGVPCPVAAPSAGDDPWVATPPAAESPPARGLVSIDVTPDGRHAVIAAQRDHSAIVLDLAVQPPQFINLYQAHCIGEQPVRVRSFERFTVIVAEHATWLTLLDLGADPVRVFTVDVPLYTQDVIWDPARQRYHVTSKALDAVLSFDASWNRIGPAGGIPVGRYPGPMAIGADGRLYVGNRGTWDVSVVDVDAGVVVATIYLGSRPESLAATASSVVVTHHGGGGLRLFNRVPVIDDDQRDIANVVTEITANGDTFETVDLDLDQGADYAGIDADAATGLVAFAGTGSGTVHVHDRMDAPIQTIDLLDDTSGLPGGRAPSGLRIFSDTRDVAIASPDRLLAINFLRSTLVELRRSAASGRFRVASELALNQSGVAITAFQSQAGAVNFNRAQNGLRYFTTLAAWKRGQADFTCATCHSDGHSDLRAIFDGKPDPHDPGSVQGEERHPSARFSGDTLPLAWEGTVVGLEQFNLAALDAHDVPTELSPGPVHTDGATHDVGTGRVLDTPTLRGLWDHAPYLHDGRAWALDDVVDAAIYDAGATAHGNLAGLSAADRAALVAFLRGL